jgi:hypothetical protein
MNELTYKTVSRKGRKLVLPEVINKADGITFKSTCRECGGLVRRKAHSNVLDVMASKVQKQLYRKDGELHKAYIDYTAVIGSCSDHYPQIIGRKSFLSSLTEGNWFKQGAHYFVRCDTFERKQFRHKFKMRSGPSRNFKTIYKTTTQRVLVDTVWVRLDVLTNYVESSRERGLDIVLPYR